MKAIQYIGTKPSKRDNVAGTGLVWSQGEVHLVQDAGAAFRLLAHPLVWKEAPASELAALIVQPLAAAIASPASALPSTGDTGNANAGSPTSTDPNAGGQYKADLPETPGAFHVDTPNLQGMTKADLVAYGEATFRESIDVSLKKEDIIQRLVDLHAHRTAAQGAQGQGT